MALMICAAPAAPSRRRHRLVIGAVHVGLLKMGALVNLKCFLSVLQHHLSLCPFNPYVQPNADKILFALRHLINSSL